MATINLNYKTIADVAKDLAPDGSELITAEILEESTPMMEDMMMLEGNLPTGHKTALRTELPSGSWVGFYEGVSPTKGKKQTVTFNTAMLRAISETDANLLKISNNENVTLMQDAKVHIMGMGQDFEDQIIYGSKSEPQKFPGLAATFDHLSTSETDVGYNVLDAGGTGSDNTSIWFMYWGATNVHGIYPKGSMAGLSKHDYGTRLTPAPDGGGDYEARKIIYRMDGGLAIPDWRSVVRIANIDVSELLDAGESTYNGAALINLMIRASHKFKPQVRMGRPYIYANTEVITALDLIANNKTTLAIKSGQDAAGKPFLNFRGIPIRLADRIVNDEARVTT